MVENGVRSAAHDGADSQRFSNVIDHSDESIAASQKSLQESQILLANAGKQGSTGADKSIPKLSIATDADGDPGEKDSDHIDVGKQISWSKQIREDSRPRTGEGYYDVMQRVGQDLFGRKLNSDEVKLLIGAAGALQEHRGQDSKELNSRDELLPKNEDEMNVFINSMDQATPGKLSDHDKEVFLQGLFETFQNHETKPGADQVIMDLRPVKDQPVVTKVVPSAVYIDSSNIEGGQGYRRKEDCSPETQTYWLGRPTAEAFMRAQTWLIKNGHDPMMLENMNGAGRRAIDRILISKCAPGQPHAKKHSTHEDGISVDVANYDDQFVRKALTKEGFVHNVPGDRPHFTWFGNKK